jgi:hypothetical protein
MKNIRTQAIFQMWVLSCEVIPLELTSSIPVGWRQPSYKILKGSKEFKASFIL